MKMPVLFNALFDWTDVFYRIAGDLKNAIDPYYLTSAAQFKARLIALGVPPEKILDLSATKKEIKLLGPVPRELWDKVKDYEKQGPSFYSLMMMSRFYSPKLSEGIIHYLAKAAFQMENFFKEKGIRWVFSEPTNAIDILAYSVCKKNHIYCGNIAHVRHPANRMGILCDFQHSRFFDLAPCERSPTLIDAERWLGEFQNGQQMPAYLCNEEKRETVFNALAKLVKRIGYAGREISGQGQINYSQSAYVLKSYFRKLSVLFRVYDSSFNESSFIDNSLYAVYFLHVQPESIDVLAPYMNNQMEVIRALRRALPSQVKLVVKEHPSAFGICSFAFYRGLVQLPGVSLVRRELTSHQIMQNAAFIATVSGTAGLEAALKGIPVIVFSRVFFSTLPNIRQCHSLEQLPDIITQVLQQPEKSDNREEIVNFIYRIMQNSVECYWNGQFSMVSDRVISDLARLIHRAIVKTESCANEVC